MTKKEKLDTAKELAKVLLASVEEKPVEEKPDVIEPVEENIDDVPVEENPIEEKPDVIEPVEEKPEINLENESMPKMEDVLNLQGLSKVIDLPNLQDGYMNISASVVEGKIVWGNLYTEDYKVLMSEQKDSSEKEILKLQEELKAEKEMVEVLSAAKPSEKLINAPVVKVESKPLSRRDTVKASIK